MPTNKILRGKTLSEQVYEALSERIRSTPPGDNRLPSEEDLAKEYGVSRATIREACNQLSSGGYVKKVPGRGMMAHPSVFAMRNRIDVNSDFKLLLAQNYKNIELHISHTGVLEHPSMIGAHPWHCGGGEIFGMNWTYSGDGKKLIYGLFELPVSVFRTLPPENFHVKDLTEFGEQYLKVPFSYCAMYAKCGFNAEVARLFGVEESRPMQCWEETLFDIEDSPIGYSTFYLHPDELVVSVLAKF